MHFKILITHTNANIKEQVSLHTISVILAALAHPPPQKKPPQNKIKKTPTLYKSRRAENVAVSQHAEHVEVYTSSISMKQQKVLKYKIYHGNIYECCLNYITK